MEGPRCASGDVNGDGLEDFFVGGAKGDSGKLFLQDKAGGFLREKQAVFETPNAADQVGITLFDADADNDLDLAVVYGGNEDMPGHPYLRPDVYLNNGKGFFSLAPGRIPNISTNASCIRAGDVDGDGDMDLFIGGRSVSGKYGFNPKSYLLLNDGEGRFTDETATIAPSLSEAGMITDAVWQDVNKDRRPDLVVVGEWMPLTTFYNNGKKLEKRETANTEGWWNCITAADVDGDGDADLVLGNLGINAKLKGDVAHPIELYAKDFDNNGQTETVLTYYKSDSISYPLHLKPELTTQMPVLRKKFLKYADYAGKSIDDVFDENERSGALIKKAVQLQSCIAFNDGKGTFTLKPLPLRAQFSPVYSFLVDDLDGDGKLDILGGGNFFGVKPELGRYDASYTTFLKGNGNGAFTFIPNSRTGIIIRNEIRDIIKLKTVKSDVIVFIKNNDAIEVYRNNTATFH
jgi:hypothetical protein